MEKEKYVKKHIPIPTAAGHKQRRMENILMASNEIDALEPRQIDTSNLPSQMPVGSMKTRRIENIIDMPNQIDEEYLKLAKIIGLDFEEPKKKKKEEEHD